MMSTALSHFYIILERAVQMHGHDLGLALRQRGISPLDGSHHAHVPLAQIRQVWSVAYQLCGAPLLGCAVIPHLSFNDVGTLDLLNVASASRQEIIAWGKTPFLVTPTGHPCPQAQGAASSQSPSLGSHR
jgi:hypothetical protein